MRKRSPQIAAILNLFFWGLGYLYVGKTFLGLCLMTSVLLILSASGIVMTDPTRALGFMFLAWFMFGIAFAYDAYKIAKEKKNGEKS